MVKPFSHPILVTRPIIPDKDSFYKKIDEIFQSKWLTNDGGQLKDFKKRLKNYLKVKNISAFCNGTLALQLACKALELTGEVITTPFTFPATSHALVWNNLTPVFCDIEEKTFNIDPKKIEGLITEKTSAIMPVHVFGNPCDVNAIDKIAKKYNLKVIYDAAHAFGVEINGVPIGNFGNMSMFSFHATKIFNTLEGGALSYTDPTFEKKLYFLKNFGIKNQEEVVAIGSNAKMNEMQAAFGILNLDIVNREIAKRRLLTLEYRKSLKNIKGVSFFNDIEGIKHNYQYMPVIIENSYGVSRDYLFDRLKEYNIFPRKYFYPLCTKMECYKYLIEGKKTDLPIAEKIASKILCIPLYGDLSLSDIQKICGIISYISTKGRKKKNSFIRFDNIKVVQNQL